MKASDESQKAKTLLKIINTYKKFFYEQIERNYQGPDCRGIICNFEDGYFTSYDEDFRDYLGKLGYYLIIHPIFCKDCDIREILTQRLKDELPRELRRLARYNLNGDISLGP